MLNSNNPTPLNVVITAASSPLGRETVRQFVAHGHIVTGLTHGVDGAAKVRADGGIPAYSDLFRAGEIKSILHMAAADVIVNLAPQIANTFPYPGMPWEENIRLLSEGTTALLDAVNEGSTKYIIHTSYGSVYGDTHGEWVDESHVVDTIPELSAVIQAEERILGAAIPAAVLRAGFTYGPEDVGMMELAEAARRGRGLFLGDPHAYHNWVYGADFANAIVLAAEQQTAGQVLNIVDDMPVSAVEFAGHLAEELGISAPSNNMNLPDFARRLVNNPIQEALLGISSRIKNNKAKAALGWTPRSTDYRAGIEQTLITWRTALPVK